MANNEILQIVVFSLFFGIFCAALGELLRMRWSRTSEQLSQAILDDHRLHHEAGAATPRVRLDGGDRRDPRARHPRHLPDKFVVEFYFGLLLLWSLLVAVGYLFFGGHVAEAGSARARPFCAGVLDREQRGAAYPKMMEQLKKFPIRRKIISFVLPVGYSFNLDGSMMYCTFATMFIAQVLQHPARRRPADHHRRCSNKTIPARAWPAVPRASLRGHRRDGCKLQPAEAGFAPADHRHRPVSRHGAFWPGDVIGNSLATAVVAKWEGEKIVVGVPPEAILEPRPA